jgi:hypothetical protein
MASDPLEKNLDFRKNIEISRIIRYFNTMLAKKGAARAVRGPRNSRASLENLYARRLAIDTVIDSLEDYDRYRARRLDERKRKSA